MHRLKPQYFKRFSIDFRIINIEFLDTNWDILELAGVKGLRRHANTRNKR